jgi:integrase
MGRNRDGEQKGGWRNGIREASSSSYEISFVYRGTRCRERIKGKPSPANFKRVSNFLGSIKLAIEKETFDYAESFPDSPRRLQFIEHQGKALTVRQYLDSWHEEQKSHLKASTYDDYRKTIKRINESMGKVILADLNRKHVVDFLAPLKVSNKTLSNLQSPLRKALQDATRDMLIEKNPLFDWSYQRVDAPKKESDVDPFTSEEQAPILGAMSGQLRNLYQFAFWSGLRTSELAALDWTDIDFQNSDRGIRVWKAKTLASKEIEVPKTKKSVRFVKLLEPAYQALIAQKQHTFLAGKEVFQHPNLLQRWTGDKQMRESFWRPMLEKAKVRYRRPYQTRHTYASMMLSVGEPLAWVAAQLGHTDTKMVEERYGKFMPEAMPDAGSKAVAIFFGGTTS